MNEKPEIKSETSDRVRLEREVRPMLPTMEFRWKRISGADLNGFTHPLSFRYGDSRFFHVLQQRWTSPYVGEPDEWRDVPIA